MSKIEEIQEQIQIKETDKNRSIEDLLMDVIGCLVDAKRNKERRGNLLEFTRVKDLFVVAYPNLNYFEKEIFELDYNCLIRYTLEDHLACAVIKLLEIAKIKEVTPVDTDSQNYYKYHWVGKSIAEFIYDIIEVFYNSSSKGNLSKISIAIKRIEILSTLLGIDLWHHVELRLKYNQVKQTV